MSKSKPLLLQLELQQQLQCRQQLEKDKVRVIHRIRVILGIISDGIQGERHQHGEGDRGETSERGQDRGHQGLHSKVEKKG